MSNFPFVVIILADAYLQNHLCQMRSRGSIAVLRTREQGEARGRRGHEDGRSIVSLASRNPSDRKQPSEERRRRASLRRPSCDAPARYPSQRMTQSRCLHRDRISRLQTKREPKEQLVRAAVTRSTAAGVARTKSVTRAHRPSTR